MRNQTGEKKKERQILVFELSSGELGLDISCVREVLRQQEIHRLPKTLDFIEGVISLRGHIVPLIDLRKRLQCKPVEEPCKRIIVCKVEKMVFGLTVDSLKEIVALPEENIRPTSEFAAIQMETDVTSGLAKLGERIIPILDLGQIVTKKEASELSGID